MLNFEEKIIEPVDVDILQSDEERRSQGNQSKRTDLPEQFSYTLINRFILVDHLLLGKASSRNTSLAFESTSKPTPLTAVCTFDDGSRSMSCNHVFACPTFEPISHSVRQSTSGADALDISSALHPYRIVLEERR